MSSYISSNCLGGIISYVSKILTKFKENRNFLSKLKESLESLRNIVDYLQKSNLKDLKQKLVRNLEISIDNAVRYIFKRLKVSKLIVIFKLDSERFKLKMLMRNIIDRLTQANLIYLSNYIDSFKLSLEKLDQALEELDELDSKLSQLQNTNNEFYESLVEAAKQSKAISQFYDYFNCLLPKIVSKDYQYKHLVYASIGNYFRAYQFLKSNDTDIIGVQKEANVSVIEFKKFIETFIEISENKKRLLKYKIIPILENGKFMDELYFLCLNDNADSNPKFHRKGSFLRIEGYLNRFSLLNQYVSREDPIALVEREGNTYKIKPLLRIRPIFRLIFSKEQLKKNSNFLILYHGEDSDRSFEYIFEVVKIEGSVDGDETLRYPYIGMKIHLMVNTLNEIQEEIIFPDQTKYYFLNKIITFENGKYFLQPRNKLFSIFFCLKPLLPRRLNSSTILRIGNANYQVVYK